MNDGRPIPSIHVYYSSLIEDTSIFNQLLYGIEEEGIPFNLQGKEESSAIKLSYLAAQNSTLDVGVGVGEAGEVILHYTKLNKDKPLFQIHLKEDVKKLRNLGANGARLVKGLPFKELEAVDVEYIGVQEKISKEEVALIVSQVLNVIKKMNS